MKHYNSSSLIPTQSEIIPTQSGFDERRKETAIYPHPEWNESETFVNFLLLYIVFDLFIFCYGLSEKNLNCA